MSGRMGSCDASSWSVEMAVFRTFDLRRSDVTALVIPLLSSSLRFCFCVPDRSAHTPVSPVIAIKKAKAHGWLT